MFDGTFEVREARVVGERHARYKLRGPGERAIEAIHFNAAENLPGPGPVQLAYRLGVNRYQGYETPELRVELLSK